LLPDAAVDGLTGHMLG